MKLKTGSAFCCILGLSVALVRGAPASTEKRVSRDIDKFDGLRARLLRLQEQIDALDSKKAGTSGSVSVNDSDAGNDDVSAEDDVNKLQPGSEMTPNRQQLVQKLAKKLDDGVNNDIHLLAEALNGLLMEKYDKMERLQHSNSAGEYLGDSYKGDKKESQLKKKSDGEGSQLENIYNMLYRMYSQQQQQGSRQPQHALPAVRTDEGSFGAFVDEFGEKTAFTTASGQRSRNGRLREAVLTAVESKLIEDVEEAQEAGISVDDIIQDIQSKGAQLQRERRRRTAREINRLPGRGRRL